MSEDSSVVIARKKRRLQGSCDICRQKKIRCDSVKMPGNVCSNCLAFGSACTHRDASKSKRNPFGNGDVLLESEQLEGTAQNNEESDLWPNDTTYEPIRAQVAAILSSSNPYVVPKDHSAVRHTLVDLARYIKTLEQELVTCRQSKSQEHSPKSNDSSTLVQRTGTSSDAYVDMEAFQAMTDAMGNVVLSDELQRMTSAQSHARFYGNSSNIDLIKAAVKMKKNCAGDEATAMKPHVLGVRRPTFWSVPPGKFVDEEVPMLDFPEDDLIQDLVELFFQHVNTYFPVLHRQTFQRSIGEGLHSTHHEFACLVLAVCATASRYSNDPRVFSDSSTEDLLHTAGWKWYKQVRRMNETSLNPPSVYKLQMYSIAVLYDSGTASPDGCWVLLGLGIRYAQSVGAHRKRHADARTTVEAEIWKRAFWALIATDIIVSVTTGRPRATTTNDFDIDMPVDCDDEYWENPDPALAFKQPHGVPSKATHWILCLKLLDILAFAHRTIYAIKDSDIWMDFSPPQQDRSAIIQIDSALNRWIDSVPEHLRWDPHRENQAFFDQAAHLYTTYYYIQILVHRPFISSRADTSFPSLAICANAARSCSHVMDIQSRRGYLPLPTIQIAMFNAAIVLLLNAWSGKRLGLSTNPAKEMLDVYRCMSVLRSYEARFQDTGRYCDLLEDLIAVGGLKCPPPSGEASLKRGRDSDIPVAAPMNGPDPSVELEPRSIASSSRIASISSAETVSHPLSQSYSETSPGPLEQPWSLPLYTNDLGRLPIHETFDFLDDSQGLFDNMDWMGNYQDTESQITSHIGLTVPNVMDSVISSSSTSYEMQPSDLSDRAGNAQHPPAYNTMDADIMAMLSNTPRGSDWEMWSSYIAGVEDLMHPSTAGHSVDPPDQ